MEQGYLVDTNIVIYFLRGRLNAKALSFLQPLLQKKANLSIITKIELLSWDEYPPVSNQFVNDSRIFPLDEKITDICIDIGRKYRIKLPDAIIAATILRIIWNSSRETFPISKRIDELLWRNPFED
jgi:predicted nucleic acid-binding protein